MAKQTDKPEATTAVALRPADASALQLPPELDALLDEAAPSIDPGARKVPWIVWNLKGEDAAGERTRPDRLYITGEDEPLSSVELVPLEIIRKGYRWRHTEDGQDTVLLCMSADRVTGTRAEGAPNAGETLDCKDCGICWRWGGSKGKRQKPEGSSYEDLAFLDPADQRVLMVRVQRTSLQAWHEWLRSWVIGRRPLRSGGRGDWPLFVYRVSMTAAMASKVRPGDARDYSIPQWQVLRQHTAEEIAALLPTHRALVAELRAVAYEDPEAQPAGAAVEQAAEEQPTEAEEWEAEEWEEQQAREDKLPF